MAKISAYSEQIDPTDDDYHVIVRGGVNYKIKLSTMLEYVPTTPGDWGSPEPTTIKEALDVLAASVGSAVVADGDKGDIIVSGSGTVWELESDGLQAIGALTPTADGMPYFTGASSAALTQVTAFARTLLDDTDAATMRATLSLGSIATQAANNVSITGGSISGITDLALADGGTGASLADPNADRIMFWDDSAGQVTWLQAGEGVTITGTTITAGAGSSLSADELAYWQAKCAMLDPAAFVHLFSSSFDVTVPSSKTYYIFNAWNARLGTNGGTFFHRNPGVPVALGEGTNIKGNGTSDAFLYYCDPSLVSYTDPKAKYFERLARLQVLVCNHIYTETAATSALAYTPFPSDFSNGLVVMAQAHDVAWTILTNTSAVTPGKCNLMNEVSDQHQWRSAEGLLLPFARSVFSGIGCAPMTVSGSGTTWVAGNGSCMYYKLPSDW